MWTAEDRSKTYRILIVVIAACFAWVGLSMLLARPAKADTRLPHPHGCPARAFCGCGAAVDIFGSPVRWLWPSSAWLRFPRTSPKHNTVAVRRGHVFVLKQHVRGHVWMVNDYNNGRHQSRYHPRSIAGYVIVDPHTRVAVLP